jgi:UDP-N-acetylmuramoyl-tripeptide--D-alanyl-D-alanine ligase
MEVTERADGVTVVNDAYNANPDSMRAALKALAAMGVGRRTWAVLGSMLELGEESTAEHDAIGRLAVRLNVGRLVVVGETARPMATGAQHEGSWGDEAVWVPDADAAYALLEQELRPGDVVLFKSSRDAGLRWLGDRIAGDGTDRNEVAT